MRKAACSSAGNLHSIGTDPPFPRASLSEAEIKVQGTLGIATGRRLLLPEFFFETRGHVPFVNEQKRLEPVDMHYAERVTDEVAYHLPPGFTVEASPKDTNVSWTGHAILVVKTAMLQGQITVGDTLTRGFTLAKAEEYRDLRSFYQKVAAADQEQVVLTETMGNGN